MNKTLVSNGLKSIVAASLIVLSQAAMSHGDVSPQPVDTEGLDQLCDEWLERNPYIGNKAAVEIGASAYNQNCARCHGLGAVSGGIAPDLRELPNDAEGDEWYQGRVRNGAVRNGVTYMPKFAESDGGPLSQEALWAIRAYTQTLAIDGAEVVEERTEAQIKAEKMCIISAKADTAEKTTTKHEASTPEKVVLATTTDKPAKEVSAKQAEASTNAAASNDIDCDKKK